MTITELANKGQVSIESDEPTGNGRRLLKMNLGPQHPATHGTLRLILELDGEIVVKCTPEIGYLHTGFEKLGEHHSYNQFVVVTDRMNYLSPICNNVGYTLAVEELMGVEIPERGQWARTIMCELTRLADHVICVGLSAMDLGAFSVMLWTMIQRENMYDVFENVTGARLTTSWTRVGGIFRDLPPDFDDLVRRKTKDFSKVLDEVEMMLNKQRIWRDRTMGVGKITMDMVKRYAITGPVARASGFDYDLRRDRPYLKYPELDFKVPVHTDGDVFARYQQRILEMRESLSMVNQCLKKMPKKGPLSLDDFKVTLPDKQKVYTQMESLIHHFKLIMKGHGIHPPVNEFYSATEAPNGELGWYIVSDGSGVPYKVRVRPPSFINYACFPEVVEGGTISDLVATLSSLNTIAGELDR